MSATVIPFLPVDGPLALAGFKRERVEKMGNDLVRFDAYQNEQDAVRSLFGNGYRMVEICLLLPDARHYAMQVVVAREMGQP